MNISPNGNGVPSKGIRDALDKFKKKVGQKCLDRLPSHTQKESERGMEKMRRVDEFISDPMWNRGIMGVSAVLTQPIIDYNNPRVDKETREVSAIRTICKIIAGTTVGMFCVRGPMRNIVKSLTDINGTKRWSKLLLPKSKLVEISKNEKFLKNYRSALAMVMSLGAMMYTNFALDAPLTIFLTNLSLDKKKELEAKNSGDTFVREKEVKNG